MRETARVANVEVGTVGQETVNVRLYYPRLPEHRRFLEIDLSDVRAADGIRVSYDFDRDGWKIEQASRFEWEGDDAVCDPDWQEVAFVAAWAREVKVENREEPTP